MVGLEEVVKELQAPPMEEEEGAEEAAFEYHESQPPWMDDLDCQNGRDLGNS